MAVSGLEILKPIVGGNNANEVKFARGNGNPNSDDTLNNPKKFPAGSQYLDVASGIMYYAQDKNSEENYWYPLGSAPDTEASVSE